MRNLDKAIQRGKDILRENPHRDLTCEDVITLMELVGYKNPDADAIFTAITRAFDIGVGIGHAIGIKDGMKHADILSLKEVANLYHVSVRTVHRWMKAPHPLPCTVFANAKAVRAKDLELWGLEHLKKNPDGTVEYTEGEQTR